MASQYYHQSRLRERWYQQLWSCSWNDRLLLLCAALGINKTIFRHLTQICISTILQQAPIWSLLVQTYLWQGENEEPGAKLWPSHVWWRLCNCWCSQLARLMWVFVSCLTMAFPKTSTDVGLALSHFSTTCCSAQTPMMNKWIVPIGQNCTGILYSMEKSFILNG